MTDFPDVKLKALVSFPATVADGAGVDVSKTNGVYQFNLDFGDFAPPVGSISDPANQMVLVWNAVTGQYVLAPATLFGYGVPAPVVRETLTAARTYFVRTDGNDANTGLADTSGGAFLTMQKAVDVTAGLDLSVYNVTIQLANGTYTAGVIVSKPWVGAGKVKINGDTTTPANVIISTAGDCLWVSGTNSKLQISGVKVVSSGGSGIRSEYGASVELLTKVEFGACGGFQIIASSTGVLTCNSVAVVISGGSNSHLFASANGVVEVFGSNWTFSGTPAFGYFAWVQGGQVNSISCTLAGGTLTATRYSATLNGVINSNGGGANYFPGTIAGVASTGGQYA